MSNRLSLRSPVPLMRLSDRVQVLGAPLDLRAPRLTLLVHGWNNSEEDARSSFEAFEALLRKADLGHQSLGAVWQVHWPSDHANGLLSPTTYSVRVGDAQNVGRMLADWLSQELSPLQEVRLVGHSLGCRVVLEALRRAREDPGYAGARVSTVVLLAAAVPQLYCTRAPYPFIAPTDSSNQHVYYSRRDRALGAAFNAGQRHYGEPGDAVGRKGLPLGRWDSRIDSRLGHGKYWRSRTVAGQVAAQLRGGPGAGAAQLRGLPTLGPAVRTPARRSLLRRVLRRRR